VVESMISAEGLRRWQNNLSTKRVAINSLSRKVAALPTGNQRRRPPPDTLFDGSAATRSRSSPGARRPLCRHRKRPGWEAFRTTAAR
jgi:hypothetical protein